MLQNLLLTGTGFNPDANGCTSQTKINNPGYLFSDIIHLVGSGQSKTGYNFSTDDLSNNSQLNFTDVLGKYIQTPDNNNSSTTDEQSAIPTDQINNQQEASTQAQNNLSFTGLQEFLTSLFNRLSAMGFKLTQIKGLSLNSGSNQNNKTSANQNETTANNTTISLNDDLLSLIFNTQGNNGNLNKGLDNNSKSSKQVANSTQSAGDKINTIIFNLLKQNKPIILNINFPGQNIKIEIAGLNKSGLTTGNIDTDGSAESLSAGSKLNGTKIGKTQAGMQINGFPETSDSSIQSNDNSIEINLSSEKSNVKISTGKSSNKPTITNAEENFSTENLDTQGNQVKFVGNNDSAVSNLISLNEQINALNNKNLNEVSLNSQKVSTIGDEKNSIEVNLVSTQDEMLINQSENLTNNSATLSADASIHESSGKISSQAYNKYTVTISSKNIKDLESILQEFSTNNITDNKLINPQQKLLYQLNGVEIKNNLDGVGNGNENDTVSAFLNNFSNVKAKLSSTSNPENNTNSKISDGKNIYKINAENSSPLYSNTVKKEIFNQSNTINANNTTNVSDATGNSTNNLAGALQSGDQVSTGSNNQQVENNNVSGVKLNNDISPAANLKAGTTGGESGKKSGSGNKQFDDSKIYSGQLLNTDRQGIIKNSNVNQNLDQLNNVYKTINANELISELSGYMGQGKSQSVMLKLKPENLGKVNIVLKVVDKMVHANLEVENESVKQAIQNNISSLKQSLNMNGLQLSSITVSLSGGESKPDKAFTQHQKKKTSRGLNSKKIITGSEPVASKNMGYNTYEYLI